MLETPSVSLYLIDRFGWGSLGENPGRIPHSFPLFTNIPNPSSGGVRKLRFYKNLSPVQGKLM